MCAAANIESLIADARSGDRRATGRLITIVEENTADSTAVLAHVYSKSQAAWITGLTGAPGAGKSTLADRLITAWRNEGRRVAVLAVDPTSPFTGGALLGDRIRMEHGTADPDVLVRSMATRGWLGGMARATQRVATLCAGLGYNEILIETVGVGQSEVDIAEAADTTVVVVTPGWGDGVQVAKAGVMEIADVFVVNKADRHGTADTVRDIEEMLRIGAQAGPLPRVVATVATSGEGIDALIDALQDHRPSQDSNAMTAARRARRLRHFERAVFDAIHGSLEPTLATPAGQALQESVGDGAIDPWTAAAELLAANLSSSGVAEPD